MTRKEILAWCCFDFANSAFTTVMVTVLFSVYFCKFVFQGAVEAETWWGNTQAIGQVLVVLISPFLGIWMDTHAAKKKVLKVTWLVCVAATFCLGFVFPGDRFLAVFLFVIALVAFSLGENGCASFLPELSTPETVGKISGYGWSFGYLGGLLSLLICLGAMKVFYSQDPEGGLRMSAIITSIFFLFAALPTFAFLKEREVPKPQVNWKEFRTQWWGGVCEISRKPSLRWFFISFFFYMAAMSTVIGFASIYAEKELGYTLEGLISFFIVLQISSAIGAFGCGFLQDRWGSHRCLSLAIVLWVAVIFAAGAVRDKAAFFLVGNIAGLAIGSTQSMARALLGSLVEKGREGEFFSYWGAVGKLAAAVGPLTYGWIVFGSGSSRMALYGMIPFLIVGFIALSRMRSTA